VEECLFDWTVERRLSAAAGRAADGNAFAMAAARLGKPPSIDRLVVCHGDACAPNTLLTNDGHWSGHVDLGSLGIADRWADVPIATWSTEWNYGPGWENLLLSAYGVTADPLRTRYYRLMWDLDP